MTRFSSGCPAAATLYQVRAALFSPAAFIISPEYRFGKLTYICLTQQRYKLAYLEIWNLELVYLISII
jgi:hypothetical protein